MIWHLTLESKDLLKHKHICLSDIMRTTIELRDDIYQKIVKEHGKRRISMAINEILIKYFLKKGKDMFGADPWLRKADLGDLRDEDDRDV